MKVGQLRLSTKLIKRKKVLSVSNVVIGTVIKSRNRKVDGFDSSKFSYDGAIVISASADDNDNIFWHRLTRLSPPDRTFKKGYYYGSTFWLARLITYL